MRSPPGARKQFWHDKTNLAREAIMRLHSTMLPALPTPDELIFALKTFTGAMAAFYLSLWLGLDNPYWAMATAFIVAQPFAGAMRSKAVYRFCGTLLGGTAAVVMVPNLVNAPVLLSLAMALWIALCLYLALLDRSARSYAFMLAGYSAGIIGFPAVSDPGHIFQTALTRVEEISIGIACTTMVGTIIFPRPLGPVLAQRIGSWVQPARDWALAALAGAEESTEAVAARRRLAFEATDAAMMISQLGHDTSHLQSAVHFVNRLRVYVISLMPVLSAIGDRVAHLKRLGGITPELAAVLDGVGTWLRRGGPEAPEALLGQIGALEQTVTDWAGLLRASLCVRLEELIRLVHHSRAIRRHVIDGDEAPKTAALEAEYVAAMAETHDHKLALLSAFAAAAALLVLCFIWIETGWTYGAGAAVIAAVACSFFAAQDDPAPAIAQMLRNAVIVCAGIWVYDFAILPRVSSFAELCLVLSPVGLTIGFLISRPATFGTGMLLGAMGSTQLSLENGYHADFSAYANSSIALIIGLGSALVITRLIRSVGAAWSAERLMRANWHDVALAASAEHDRARLTGLILDRLGLMMPRMAAVASGADTAASGALKDLRVGLNMIALHREQWHLPDATQKASAAVFAGVAAHYEGDARAPAPEALCAAIDAAIRPMLRNPQAYKEALMIFSGLRIVLFPAHQPPDLLTALTEAA
jgi:uncharacterized membrane protein YccC